MDIKIIILSLIVSTTCATSISTVRKELPNFEYLKEIPNNFTNITNQINGILKSLNISDIEVYINLNHISSSIKKLNYNDDIDLQEFQNSLKYLFKTTIAANWHMKDILKDIVTVVDNVTIHEILYEILWEEIKRNDNKNNNPFFYIELYKDIEEVLKNYTSVKLTKLLYDVQEDLVQYSANILQSYFIHNSTIRILLDELKKLDNLYQITMPVVFKNLNSIENQWLIAEDLLNFDSTTSEAVYNHITYIKNSNSLNKTIPNIIYYNLESLIARPDFINISANERQESSKLLPLSMGKLFGVKKVCLKNITTNFYLYECPHTYLMCTNKIENNQNRLNRKKAVYEIERIGKDGYTLHSPYWSRYLRLKNNHFKKSPPPSNLSNNTNFSRITKNLYSHVEASSWLIRFHGNYATIQDSNEKSYVCGGDSSYWSNVENYAYTRKVIDFDNKQNECLWLLEDCSDVN